MPSKIDDLPFEIFVKIFREGKNMGDDAKPNGHNVPHRNMVFAFEVLVSHVCSYFRHISLTTPELWTSINVHSKYAVGQVVERLARSGTKELSIRIKNGQEDPQIAVDNMDQILDALVAHSLRWRSLILRQACEGQGHPVVMRLCSSPAPRLQFLSLTVNNVDANAVDGAAINQTVKQPHILRNATVPPLEFIRLRGLAVQFFRPSLSTVVTLHLEKTRYLPMHFSTLHNIMTCSPYLANLSIHGDIVQPGDWPGNPSSIHLPSLRSLRLFSESGEAYSGMLQSLDAPMLEELTLKTLQEHDLDPFLDAIQENNKFQKVTSLNFVEFDFILGRAYMRLFQIFQSITTFSVLGVPDREPRLLKLLTQGKVPNPNGSSYTPWPMLKTLRFGTGVWDSYIGMIAEMVKTRQSDGCPMSALVFSSNNGNGADTASLLDFQKQHGVEVNFSTDIGWPANGTHLDHEDTMFSVTSP